ncbi:MAG: caspase domain-containing protein [Benjaminiella poitrasii]|nr:MAG: caspase domain-containing protein [Benjaminiella poitrasii]
MEELLERMQPTNTTQNNSTAKLLKRKASDSLSKIPKSDEYNKVVAYLGSSSGYYLVRNILSSSGKEAIPANMHSGRRDSAYVMNDELVGPVRFRKINVVDDGDIMYVRDKTLAEHADQLETDKLDLDFNIVPQQTVKGLVERFFQLESVSLPLIDKETFMNAYEGRTQPSTSPILLYSICIHTCLLLPIDDPIFEHLDRTELFSTLVEHTTKLVKKEYLIPRHATIQALVLLCTYPFCDKSLYKNWIRSGMAVRMAQELGLHRTVEKLPLTEEMLEARKRLWYCVYVTDRWTCAVLGRPLAIADADCDVDLPHVKGGNHGTEDYSIFIHLIKLSGILGEVLRKIYSPKAKSQGYKTADKKDVYPELFDEANKRCIEAATMIVDIARLLSSTDIVRFGWNFSVYSLLQACIIHVYNTTSTSTELASLSREYVKICTTECIEPITRQIANAPQHFLPLIQTLMQLIGTDKPQTVANGKHDIHDHNRNNPTSTKNINGHASWSSTVSSVHSNTSTAQSASTTTIRSTYNTAFFNSTQLQQQQQQQYKPPMSVHAIVSDLHSAQKINNNNQEMTFVPNNVPTAAWQTLFSSASTPFYGNDSDWQNILSSLFDDANQPNSPLKPLENGFACSDMDGYGYPAPESYQENEYSNRNDSYDTENNSNYNSNYGYPRFPNGAGDSNDPYFTEEDYSNPNPNYPQPPESKYNPGPNPDDMPDFELSNCRGKKRALLVGINYFGTKNELNDNQEEEKFRPTRDNIIAAMQWLVHDAEADDSGHGGRINDVHGDEDDAFDETIYPLDFEQYEGDSGQITDDEMHNLLVKPLPAKCRLTCIFDSCHSGTVLDLPFVYSTKGEIKDSNLFKHAGKGLFSAGIAYVQGDKDGALSSIMSLGKQLMEIRNISNQARRKNFSQADVIMFSGCKDDQTSADANEAGRATGAMSYAFTKTLRGNPDQSYQELLNSVRDILRDKYSQRPQLSSSHPIDVNLQFTC